MAKTPENTIVAKLAMFKDLRLDAAISEAIGLEVSPFPFLRVMSQNLQLRGLSVHLCAIFGKGLSMKNAASEVQMQIWLLSKHLSLRRWLQ